MTTRSIVAIASLTVLTHATLVMAANNANPAKLPSEPVVATPGGWTLYKNARFGMEVRYPASKFKGARPPDNGGGLSFTAKDGGEFLIHGSFNSLELTLANYEQQLYAEANVTYRASGGDWLVLSGTQDGRIFYHKTIFSCGGQLLNELDFSYPEAQRKTYDPIVSEMVKTFRPGKGDDGPADC